MYAELNKNNYSLKLKNSRKKYLLNILITLTTKIES